MSDTVVVKIGGGEGIDREPALSDVASMIAAGDRVVVVHGGSDATTELSRRLGLTPRFVTGPTGRSSRFTDDATMRVFTMACRGIVNASIVERLQMLGVNAVGLSGIDGRLIAGRRKSTVKSVERGKVKLLRGDRSGTVDTVNVRLLHVLLDEGFVPVVSPPGWSDDGNAVNVDADRVAAAVAVGLGASALVFLSNVPGILRDPTDATTLVGSIDVPVPSDVAAIVTGRMHAKVDAAAHAAMHGVGRVAIASSDGDRPVHQALAGAGTIVSAVHARSEHQHDRRREAPEVS